MTHRRADVSQYLAGPEARHVREPVRRGFGPRGRWLAGIVDSGALHGRSDWLAAGTRVWDPFERAWVDDRLALRYAIAAHERVPPAVLAGGEED